jgi:hypothetical protein
MRDPGALYSKDWNEVSRIFLYHSDYSAQRKDACAGVFPVQDALRAEVGVAKFMKLSVEQSTH